MRHLKSKRCVCQDTFGPCQNQEDFGNKRKKVHDQKYPQLSNSPQRHQPPKKTVRIYESLDERNFSKQVLYFAKTTPSSSALHDCPYSIHLKIKAVQLEGELNVNRVMSSRITSIA
eukprot:Pompholyxophrys_sp_v1_NODE_105_length_1967_cov_3.812762.p1 type:complete len:116 gc:universal NODE_105_length_1967_cov_3.812762:1621-1274(-)